MVTALRWVGLGLLWVVVLCCTLVGGAVIGLSIDPILEAIK